MSRVIKLFIVGLIGISVILFYILIHEAAHALMVIVFDGKVTGFHAGHATTSVHITFTGNFEPMQLALIYLGGPMVPYIVWLIGSPFVPKIKNVLIQAFWLMYSSVIIGIAILTALLSILYTQGIRYHADDIHRFIYLSSFDPHTVSILFSLLAVMTILYVVFIGRFTHIAKALIKHMR